MQNILIVVDMQNDFIDGALGTKEAAAIVPKVEEKIRNFEGKVFFTRDTHERIIWRHRKGKTFRFLTVSGAQMDGRFGKSWTP